ncbi:hypothetical protein E2C01_023342 [Portunus trituberculatus]|uniref:Uncharacterized protein n=1 Tax=Portunus trituberculatus TaxID=210409 RepID=A0A5B7E9R2_PORTR|nr:hypothetical protein [Portunus trituberculatus]
MIAGSVVVLRGWSLLDKERVVQHVVLILTLVIGKLVYGRQELSVLVQIVPFTSNDYDASRNK